MSAVALSTYGAYSSERLGVDCAANVSCLWLRRSSCPTLLRTLISTRGYVPTLLVAVRGPSRLALHWRECVFSRSSLWCFVADRLLQEKTKTTLTMDDLGAALADYGINMRKPEFYM